MGLVVTAHISIRLIDPKISEEYNNPDFIVRNYDEFMERANILVYGGRYKSVFKNNFISYSSSEHNIFRDNLSKIIRMKERFWINEVPKNTPFYELFEFADNMGTMDSQCCENLISDFIAFYDSAIHRSNFSKQFKEHYRNWLMTVDIGSRKNCCLVFN